MLFVRTQQRLLPILARSGGAACLDSSTRRNVPAGAPAATPGAPSAYSARRAQKRENSKKPASMGRDYYALLGIERSASAEGIKRAYRKQALRWHPDRNKEDRKEAERRFQEIAEAHSVLSDPEKKAAYDRFGEEGLRGLGAGAPAPSGQPRIDFTGEPFANLDTAFRIFEQMFGTMDPFASEFDLGMNSFGTFPSMNETKWRPRPERKRKGADIFVDLSLTLEELYFGATKYRRITRRVLNAEGSYEPVSETVEIVVARGWRPGTQVRFSGMGDEAPNVIPADIVFVVQERPHARFTREGNDLVVECAISLKNALCGFSTEVTTLDARRLHVDVNEVIAPNSLKVVHNEGMPLSKDPTRFGNLLIRFSVAFPAHIPEVNKEALRALLD